MDDFLLISKHEGAKQILVDLTNEFGGTIKSCKIGETLTFLGMEISYKQDDLRIDGISKIEEFIKMMGAQLPSKTLPDEKYLSPGLDILEEDMKKLFQRAVGQLVFITTNFRPDLVYLVSELSKSMINPTARGMEALKMIAKYLVHTKICVLKWIRNPAGGFNIDVYTDASFGKSKKPILGGVILLNGKTLHWWKCDGRNVCLSTQEAEFSAAVHGIRLAIGVQKTIETVFPETPLKKSIYCDLKSVTHLLRGEILPTGLRHANNDIFYLLEKINPMLDNWNVVWLKSAENFLADSMTKLVKSKSRLLEVRERLGLISEET